MQKKNKKLVSFCSLATLVISSSVVSTTGVKAADTDTQRIGGADRYETASLISQEGWKNGSDYVVIANGQTGVDALTASPLAKAKDAPILLTEGNTLNPTALAEIKRLGAKHIIFVGGTGVIPENFASQIKSEIPSSDVARYDGKDRFETAVKIAGALGTPSGVFVANGSKFADALSAAPIAAIKGMPIILSQDKQLPKVSSDYIKSNSSITKTYVVGGSGVVSDSILNSLPGSQRLGGADRYETNAAIVSAFASELDFSGIYVARGDVFADSLTGSVLAAKNKSAMVITATSGVLSSATEKLFTDLANKGTKIISLGGSGVLPDSIISKIKDAINNSTPVTPTPGGGGGATDITKTITANKNYIDTVTRIKTGDLKNSYFTIDDSDASYIGIKLLKDNTQVEDIFNTAKEAYVPGGIVDTEKINTKVTNFNNKLKGIYTNSNLTINGATLQEVLKNSGSKYINSSDGTLNADAIIDEINKKEQANENYALKDFKADLQNKVGYYLDGHASKDNPVTLNIAGYNVTSINKNGNALYTSTDDPQTVANRLVNLITDETTITDSYTINTQAGNISVKVEPYTEEN